MERQSCVSSILCSRLIAVHLSAVTSIIPSKNFLRSRPLVLFPCILHIRHISSSSFALLMCPVKCICRCLTVLTISLFDSASFNTSSFLLLTVQGIPRIFGHNHISIACSLNSSSLLSVHTSHPYRNVNQTMNMKTMNKEKLWRCKY